MTGFLAADYGKRGADFCALIDTLKP